MSSEEDVFDALSNEVRRKIIILLAERPRSYAELMKELNIESPALAFHLKKLGPLIQKDNGNYKLTELGKKAYSLLLQLSEEKVMLKEGDEEEKESGIMDSLIDKISGIIANKVTEFATSFAKSGFKSSDPLIIVYDSAIPLKKRLKVAIDGGAVEVKPGDPHLQAKCHYPEDLSIKEQGDELDIEGDGCKLIITYPENLESLKIDVDGGSIDVSGISPESFSFSVDGGVTRADVSNFTSGSIDIDGGALTLYARPQSSAKIDISINGGTATVELGIPEGVGVFVSPSINGGILRNNIKQSSGEKGNVLIDVSLNGGVMKLDRIK